MSYARATADAAVDMLEDELQNNFGNFNREAITDGVLRERMRAAIVAHIMTTIPAEDQ